MGAIIFQGKNPIGIFPTGKEITYGGGRLHDWGFRDALKIKPDTGGANIYILRREGKPLPGETKLVGLMDHRSTEVTLRGVIFKRHLRVEGRREETPDFKPIPGWYR